MQLLKILLLHIVWDSSIVVAKYFERWGGRWAGKRCLDLSAGCGLVGAHCYLCKPLNTVKRVIGNSNNA